MSRDDGIAAGRERYHQLTDDQRTAALKAAPYTMSGLTVPVDNPRRRACKMITVSTFDRGFAEGLLDEGSDPKLACGVSRTLCWQIHDQPCAEVRHADRTKSS